MIGRNELCPCGSGKKYKKCCLQKNQSIEFTKNKVLYAKGLYKNMENKIYEFAKKTSFYSSREECANIFYSAKKFNSQIDKLYNTYFIYDYRKNNKTIIEKFADEYKLTLNRTQRNILSSMMKSNVSVFKIENIKNAKITMKDYFNDNKVVVQDIDLYKNSNINENIICRPISIQSINILVNEYIKVSDENIKTILKNIENLYEKSNKQFKNKKEFLLYNSDLIYKFAQQIILNGESSKVTMTKIDKKEEKVSKSKEKVKLGENIYNVLKNNIEDKYLQKGLDLWKEFIKSNESIKGSENGWAAAVEYYIKKDAGETITQAQISEKYEISPRTLGKRYKELKAS